MRSLLSAVSVILLLAAGAAGACGRKAPSSANDAKSVADRDPLALLPASAIVVAELDVHAMVASASVGATLASFTDALVPLGADAGFQPSRDVDRAVLGVYAGTEADLVVVMSGRFDLDKIAAASRTKAGATIVKATYAGFATDAVGAVTIAPLTAKTAVVGTQERVHRVLDRLGAGSLDRAVAPWVSDTLASPGAQFAVTADFATQPIASATLGSISLTWLKGLEVLRAIGDFDAPGINSAATLTYGDAAHAQGAADGLRLIDGWQKILAPLLFGARVRNLQISSAGRDVSSKFALDDSAVRALLGLASKYARLPAP